jgi:flagellar biosynthesis protein
MTSENTEPNKAATLQYKGKKTPIVSAIGENEQAKEILELAKKHKVPVYEDKDLVNLLTQINIGEAVPAELFEWVASAIAFAFFARNEVPEGFSVTETKTAYDKVRKTYSDV